MWLDLLRRVPILCVFWLLCPRRLDDLFKDQLDWLRYNNDSPFKGQLVMWQQMYSRQLQHQLRPVLK